MEITSKKYKYHHQALQVRLLFSLTVHLTVPSCIPYAFHQPLICLQKEMEIGEINGKHDNKSRRLHLN